MGDMKTPGVYIIEKSAFPNSVVEAPTAIPAFIGITAKAENGADSLISVPWKISSMTEFLNYFGGVPALGFTADIKQYFYLSEEQKKNGIKLKDDLTKPAPKIFQYAIEPSGESGTAKDDKGKDLKNIPVGYTFSIDGKNKNTLYYSMVMFFANGGGTCYIVSAGTYGESGLTKEIVGKALKALEKEQEVTMILVPEAVNYPDCKEIQQLMIQHCGYTMKNRITILDVQQSTENKRMNELITTFQTNIGSNYLSYATAYFPWLNTSVLGDKDLSGGMFTYTENFRAFRNKFTTDPSLEKIITAFMEPFVFVVKEGKTVTINGKEYEYNTLEAGKPIENIPHSTVDADEERKVKTITIRYSSDEIDKNTFHLALTNGSHLYQAAMKGVKRYLNLLPPSAVMAGVYTSVDNSRGVWKAPANITLNYVDSLTEDISDDEQADLNVPINGKAINVIRTFRGEGIKVWGARTLDGNSLDWRYINVRRTILFLEESVKNAARAYVFEPNDANTWINMKCMIENFLKSVWKRGGLAGTSPEDAYSVHVGLGDTMSPEDILEGVMRITVLVAISHPAEFIEITFQQQMQKS